MTTDNVRILTVSRYLKEGWIGRPDVDTVFFKLPDQAAPVHVTGVVAGDPIEPASPAPCIIVYRDILSKTRRIRAVDPDAELTVVLKRKAAIQ